MEEPTKRKRGRPPVGDSQRKKNRKVAMTDGEYGRLQEMAASSKSVSAYVVEKLGLAE